jgi:hypothetical protein
MEISIHNLRITRNVKKSGSRKGKSQWNLTFVPIMKVTVLISELTNIDITLNKSDTSFIFQRIEIPMFIVDLHIFSKKKCDVKPKYNLCVMVLAYIVPKIFSISKSTLY